MNLDRYHEQHVGIHGQLQDLHQRLAPEALAADPGAARQSLVTRGAKLSIHLAFEDQALYPPLLGNQNPTIQTKARAYMSEMGGLKETLTSHMKRWLSLQRVQQDPQNFRQETLELTQALERRLQAEDQDFYPMLERLA